MQIREKYEAETKELEALKEKYNEVANFMEQLKVELIRKDSSVTTLKSLLDEDAPATLAGNVQPNDDVLQELASDKVQ